MYNYNNGLAEGSVIKLKVIKRTMYGRCDFETLRKKVLQSESYGGLLLFLHVSDVVRCRCQEGGRQNVSMLSAFME